MHVRKSLRKTYMRVAIACAATALLITTAALITTGAVAQSDGPIADTETGRVQGVVNDQGVLVFSGIPYAADTGGANRFLPPQPRAAWEGVLDASEFGSMCPQPGTGGSEDCLFANVWTSDLSGSRPVMVHFHGGAFRSSSGNEVDGAALVKRRTDVVAVSVNHRLNVFGHLSLDESFGGKYAHSGNVGMFDLEMALRWVRDNIANFGGDPNNVTILGPSGGGAKTFHALAMPIFDGLFQHAIVIGGHDLWKRNSLASAREKSAAILAELGIQPGDIAALQAVPMDDLIAAHDKVFQEFGPDLSAGPRPWVNYDLLTPAIDGTSLPEYPIDAIAHGASADIDLMLGTSKMEHWSNVCGQPQQPRCSPEDWGWLTRKQLTDILDPYLGHRTNRIVAAYEREMPDASPSSLLHRIITDRDWHLPHLQLAEAKATGGGRPAYLWFADVEVVNSGALIESFRLKYGLGIVPSRYLTFTGAAVGQFTTAFTSFAKNGDPNHSGMPSWRPYTQEKPAMMIFGLETHESGPLSTLSIWSRGP
jgi:para-nitrobenzyl esterase